MSNKNAGALRFLRAFLCSIALLLFAIPARGEDTASTSTLRIISCAPNLTEMIFALGAGDQVIGVSTYTSYPPEAMNLPQVVDLFSPNVEAILQLRPTMIFALDSNSKVSEFFSNRADVKVIITGELETLEQINGAIMMLGRTLGREQRASELVDAQPKPVPRADPQPGPKVLAVVGYGAGLSQLYAAGHGTFLHQLLERAGARNVIAAEMGKYPVINKEALIRLNPDVIIITAPEDVDLKAKYAAVQEDWKNMQTLNAVRTRDFRFLLGKSFMIPGPRAAYLLPLFEKLIWEEKGGGFVRAE